MGFAPKPRGNYGTGDAPDFPYKSGSNR
jgi:hypothetical protein